MLSLETWGMVLYGGCTSVLFLIISLLAYRRLTEASNSASIQVFPQHVDGMPESHDDDEAPPTQDTTNFPFNRITSDMSSQQIQHISAQYLKERDRIAATTAGHNNKHLQTPTTETSAENSTIFNTKYWTRHDDQALMRNGNAVTATPVLAEQHVHVPTGAAVHTHASAVSASHINVLAALDDSCESNSDNTHSSESDYQVDPTLLPSPVHKSAVPTVQTSRQLKTPSTKNTAASADNYYYQLLSNPGVEKIHLQRTRNRHSLAHLDQAKRTCGRVFVEYVKEMVRNRSIYSPALQHTWDVATDISVLLKWGKHAFLGTDIENIDFVPLFWTSLLVQLGYRVVSGYAVYKSEKSVKKAVMQALDLLLLREIYYSHVECRITDTLVYIKKLEAVLEAAPQLILTTYFFLRVGTLESSYTEIIGWLWSFLTLSTKVINDDSKMYMRTKTKWNRQFVYRCSFRLFEICSRVLFFGLLATAISARAAAVMLLVETAFLVCAYYYGLLSNDRMNILASIITFVDLTIYPKASVLYSWFASRHRHERLPVRAFDRHDDDDGNHHHGAHSSRSWSAFNFGHFFDSLSHHEQPGHGHGHARTPHHHHSHHDSAAVSFEIKDLKVSLQEIRPATTTAPSGDQDREQLNQTLRIHDADPSDTSSATNSVRNGLTPSPMKVALTITVPESDNAAMYIDGHAPKSRAPAHTGLASVRQRSCLLLRELASVEAVYLELLNEQRSRRPFLEFRCCGCGVCWCRFCDGCLPQCAVQRCVRCAFKVVLCTSWVWCAYFCSFGLCNCWQQRHRRKQAAAMATSSSPKQEEQELVESEWYDNVAAADAPPSPPLPPPPQQQRMSISERVQDIFKKVRFADLVLKNRSSKNNEQGTEDSIHNHNQDHSENKENMRCSRSMQELVEFVESVVDWNSSDQAPEQEPEQAHEHEDGMFSLHEHDGGFPDVFMAMTRTGTARSSVRELTIREEIEEHDVIDMFPWQSPRTDADVDEARPPTTEASTADTGVDSSPSNETSPVKQVHFSTNASSESATARCMQADIHARIDDTDFATDSEALSSDSQMVDVGHEGTSSSAAADDDSGDDDEVMLINPTTTQLLERIKKLRKRLQKVSEADSNEVAANLEYRSMDGDIHTRIAETAFATDSEASSSDDTNDRGRVHLFADDLIAASSSSSSSSSSIDAVDSDDEDMLINPTTSQLLERIKQMKKKKARQAKVHVERIQREQNTEEQTTRERTLVQLLSMMATRREREQEQEQEREQPVASIAVTDDTQLSGERNHTTTMHLALQPEPLVHDHSLMSMSMTKSPFSSNPCSPTPIIVPSAAHQHALLQLAGLDHISDHDRLKRIFSSKSALNTPMPEQEAEEEEEEEEKEDVGPPSTFPISLRLDQVSGSPPRKLRLEVVDSEVQPRVQSSFIDIQLSSVSMADTLAHPNHTPHFGNTTPKAQQLYVAHFFGIRRCLLDRVIAHRFAFLVVFARALQTCLVALPCIAYLVYIQPSLLGSAEDRALSLEVALECHPWCTSQTLRADLRDSFVFLEFLIACLMCATLSVVCFVLSSPYLLFATSITRSPMSLLKTGCIYDSVQYFSKNAKVKRERLLRDYTFIRMFLDEIIKLRIPVFFDEAAEKSQQHASPSQTSRDPKIRQQRALQIQQKILKNADSEIVLTALQLHVNSGLAENIALSAIKAGYLHLLEFIMASACMDGEHRLNRLLWDAKCIDEDGNGLLHTAIMHGNERIIQYILEGCGYDERKNMSNYDCIDLLILNGDIHILRYILAHFIRHKKTDLIKKTFYRSIKRGNMEFITVLMEVVHSSKYETDEWVHQYHDDDDDDENGGDDQEQRHHVAVSNSRRRRQGRRQAHEAGHDDDDEDDTKKKTLLMRTAMYGHANSTEWLLNTVKVDGSEQDATGKTALIYACLRGNVNVVDVFMNDAHIAYFINIADNKGLCALLYATMEAHTDCVSTLMTCKSLDPNVRSFASQETALIHAAKYGEEEIAVRLIKMKHIDVNASNRSGETALMCAARFGLIKTVKALLCHDDIDVARSDDAGQNALQYCADNLAVSEDHALVHKALTAHIKSKEQAKHVDVEKLKQKRRSFLMIGELAAWQHSTKIKKRYSKIAVRASRRSQSHGQLLLASKRKSGAAVATAATTAEVDEEHHHRRHSRRDRHSRHRKRSKSKSRGKSTTLQLDSSSMMDPEPLVGDLALDDVEFYVWYSIQMDYDVVLHWLLQSTRCHLQMVGREDMDMIETSVVGSTPFHFAVKTGAYKCLRVLLEVDKMHHDTFVNERDKDGYSPLICAVMQGNMSMVELLLRYHDTEVNDCDEKQCTALMHAAMRGYANIVQLLLKHARIRHPNFADQKGKTALFLAVRYNRPRVVQLLLRETLQRIEVDKAKNNGQTPLMCAVKYGRLEIVKLLLASLKCDLSKTDKVQNYSVEDYVSECANEKLRKQIQSYLHFYKTWQNATQVQAKRARSGSGFGGGFPHFDLAQMATAAAETSNDDEDGVHDDMPSTPSSYHDFYALAVKEVDHKREHKDWNMEHAAANADIEDTLFAKWSMQLEILHVCEERCDDPVFTALWDHWIRPESVEECVRHRHSRKMSSSSMGNLFDIASSDELDKQQALLRGSQHFQNLKWYFFFVRISQKGWHRLFIRFVEEIEHKNIRLDWTYIPNEVREIDLMAKYEYVDEIEHYLKFVRKNQNVAAYLDNQQPQTTEQPLRPEAGHVDHQHRRTQHIHTHYHNPKHSRYRLCCGISKYVQHTHMKFMLEFIFENFGQAAATKERLGECLRFVLSKTMQQYLRLAPP